MRSRPSIEMQVPIAPDPDQPRLVMVERILQWDTQCRKSRAAPLLTNLGVAYLRQLLENRTTESLVRVDTVLPSWDSDTLQLWLGSTLVRQFNHRRSHQTAILDCFQSQGWEHCVIDNPLRSEHFESEAEARRQLTETVKNLSRGLAKHTIQFRVENGETIRWSFASPEIKSEYSRRGRSTMRVPAKQNG